VTLQSPFYVELKEGAEAAAKSGGDQLIFLDANGDVNKQNNDIQDLISRGVKVLILNPVNPQAVEPSIEGLLGKSPRKDPFQTLLTPGRPW
jgi:ribose transport system substrate-binding protein